MERVCSNCKYYNGHLCKLTNIRIKEYNTCYYFKSEFHGLGEIKPHYCKGNYIWLDEDGNITSKCREEFRKKL